MAFFFLARRSLYQGARKLYPKTRSQGNSPCAHPQAPLPVPVPFPRFFQFANLPHRFRLYPFGQNLPAPIPLYPPGQCRTATDPVPPARFPKAGVFPSGHVFHKPELERLAVSYHIFHLSAPYVSTLLQDATVPPNPFTSFLKKLFKIIRKNLSGELS
jgi:hypothetical protein